MLLELGKVSLLTKGLPGSFVEDNDGCIQKEVEPNEPC